ncbi:MAG TPA: GTPase HflX [Candidatus Anoxymicrobiaceae bacterium]
MNDSSADASTTPETAVLVAVSLPSTSDEEITDSLEELSALAGTAGAEVAARIVQRRNTYDPSTLMGRGKVDEVRQAVESSGASLVIFDNDLSVGQQDRLTSMLDARILDRTALILEIFALHAHTAEGRTQVELAQLSYLLPRIRGRGTELSRLGGGIRPMRGPGETKLEIDRRRIRRRMRKLDRDLTQMEAVRMTQRKQRVRAGLPSVCLVGYTNSGKSSLLNRLTGSAVLVEDQLFSTLDSTTRRLELAGAGPVVLSDTVGFIRKLPHELVAAFRSTLEVVRDADLLVHVVDAKRSEMIDERMQAVGDVLADLDAADIPSVTVLNKWDALDPAACLALSAQRPDAIHTSALTGEGAYELAGAIAAAVEGTGTVKLLIPAARGDLIAALYREGTVLERELADEDLLMVVRLPRDRLHEYARFMAGDGN